MHDFFHFQQNLLCILANAVEVIAMAAAMMTLVVMAVYAAGKQNKKATRLTLAGLGMFALGIAMPGLVSQVIRPAEAANLFVLATLLFLNLVLAGVLIMILAAPSILAKSLKLDNPKWIYIWNALTVFGGPPWGIALFLALRGPDSDEALLEQADASYEDCG